jgi:hypothetical protein
MRLALLTMLPGCVLTLPLSYLENIEIPKIQR